MLYRVKIFPAIMAIIMVTGMALMAMPDDFRDRRPVRQADYLPTEDLYVGAAEKGLLMVEDEDPEQYITRIMASYHVPGLAAAIVKGDRVLWTGSYGFANFAENRPTADTTSFMLASISKTVTCTALMQLWENGAFELDDHINDYLPFAVYNPNYPSQEITFRQVLTHTSSLKDDYDVMWAVYFPGDCPIPLGEYVEDYFTPGGDYYSAVNNFYTWAPGTAWSYCNEAFALAGYLVEAITGRPFDQYCRDSIFEPLGLEHTSWFLAGLDTSNVAMPYSYVGGVFQALGHFGYADYPAGQLRSSALDLARYITIYMNHGEVDGVRILDSATVAEILTVQFPSVRSNQGLSWYKYYNNELVGWQHGGGDQGVKTLTAFCPEAQIGVVVLTNGESSSATGTVLNWLFEYGSRHIFLADDQFSDDSGGDADQILEAGETIQLVCSFTSLFPDTISGIRAGLTVDDAALRMINAVAELGDMPPNETLSNDDQPFEFEIPSDYISRICSFLILVSGEGGTVTDSVTITKAIGHPRILLLDDDDNHSLETYYTGCLEGMRIPYLHLTSPPAPTIGDFNDVDAVIWFTGDFRLNPLDADEIGLMKNYMDAGGNLFLTGQGLGAQLNGTDPNFLHDYLRCEYLSSSLTPVLAASGGPVFDLADTISIYGYGGAINQTLPDHLSALNGGANEMVYYNLTDYGAISYSGDYSLVFFGFGFEAIVNGDSRWTERNVILSEILDFWDYRMPVMPMWLAVAPGDQDHLVDHHPEISWQSGEPEYIQEEFHIQVGADNDWSSAEMWDYGPIMSADTAMTYAGAELIDGETYYFRIRTSDGVVWSNWYYGQMRMNSRPTAPAGLIPDNMQNVDITPPSLSHINSEDSENDILTYTYELYDDSLLSSLVAQASEYPQGLGGTTVWTVPSSLPDGEDYFWRVRAGDGYEYGDWSATASFFVPAVYLCGDANGDDAIDVGDAVFLINYIFRSGSAPEPPEAGDANGDGVCNVGDAVYLINHIYRSGAEPLCP